MIRFVHTADIHLGTENYGKIDPATGIHSRLLDFAHALNYCVDIAIHESVDFFLLCGDAYKTTTPTPTQQKFLFKALMRLYKTNIPVVIVIGNHDNPASFGKAHSLDIFKELPFDGFHVIAQPQTIHLQTKSGPVNIVGIPWPTRHNLALSSKHAYSTAHQVSAYIAQSIGAIIEHEAHQLDPSVPAILAAHLTVSSGIFSGSEKRATWGNDPLFLPSRLAIPPFDYIALGHLHRHQNLNIDHQPPLIYSGSLERIDFGEKEEKGFCLVELHAKGHAEYQFIKGPCRPFIQLDIQLDPAQDQTEQIKKQIEQQSIDGAIIKIVYHVPPDIKDVVNIKAIQAACESAMHLVGVIPVRSHSARQQRLAMKVDMDLSSLLDAYFESKPQLKEKKRQLIETAMLLYEESKKVEQQTE